MFDVLPARWAGRDCEFPALEDGLTLRPWTYGELVDRVDVEEKRLGVRVPAGAPIAIVMSPHIEAVAALLAALKRGNPAVLLPTTLPPTDISSILVPAGARALYVAAEAAPEWRIVRGASRAFQSTGMPGAPIAIYQLTSGSTGAPRLALRDCAALKSEIDAVSAALGLGPEDRVACLSSVAHSYGLIGGLLAPLAAGATVQLGRSPDDLAVFGGSSPPTVIFGLAATYTALTAAQTVDLSPARLVLSAGAPLPPGLYGRFQRRFGLPIRQDYGTTETGTIALDVRGEPAPHTVGLPLPHLEVRVQGAKRLKSPSEEGEIQVRSVAVARAYLSEAGLEACVDGEGWFHTRDAGAFDLAGRLIVGRRLRDPIRLPDGTVGPDVVENVIARLDGVDECVVASTETEEGGHGIKAIVASSSLDESAVFHWLSAQMPEIAQLAEVQIVERLPRSPAGKILQKYLL